MRRYDIDWLRVIAIALLLIYHISIAFQPWGGMVGFITNNDDLTGIWPFMSMLNVWRIPFLFFVSGMGVHFAIQKRNWRALLMERTKRIFLPFLFGVLAIVPLHMLLWQKFYDLPSSYVPNPGHLWFLGNLFIYVLVLSPLFFLLKAKRNTKLVQTLRRAIATPYFLLLVIGLFIVETLLVQPALFELYAMTWHGFFIGLLAFFIGYSFEFAGPALWKMLVKYRWFFLAFAVGLFLNRWLNFQLQVSHSWMAIESNAWIFTVFAFGHKYLNKPNRTLHYLSTGAYPIYILHMVFLYLGSVLFFSLEVSAIWKLILLTAFTFVSCFISYEVIKRIPIVRPLFGLKYRA